jgi:hypothetical protein
MNKDTTRAHSKALANCAQDWHQWHPTFTLGEKVCTICGGVAYCPFCVSRPPTAARLIPCALHRSEARRAQA